MFEALGAFVFRFRWGVLVASAVFLTAAVTLLVHGGELTSGTIHGLEAERAEQIVDHVTGRPAETTFVALFHGDHLDAHGPAFASAMRAALAPLRDDPHVASILSPTDLLLPRPHRCSMGREAPRMPS